MSKEIIVPATGAVTSGNIRIYVDNDRVPSTFIQQGLAGAEEAVLQVSYDGGTTFVDVYINSTKQSLSATNNVLTINAPGIYKIAKGASAAAAGVYLVTNNDL